MPDASPLLRGAREMSHALHGRRVTFYLPGMFMLDGMRGRYPAVSITGDSCSLRCDHCEGRILRDMLPAVDHGSLVALAMRLEKSGCRGMLLSGGCNLHGRLPWSRFLKAVEEIKARTGLYLSAHCGLVDRQEALALKNAGLDQALIDVVGDDDTYRSVCHVDFGVERIEASLEALARAGLDMAPHVVCGLDHGRMRGEERALAMLAPFRPGHLVIVSLMPLRGTAMEGVAPPTPMQVASVVAKARQRMPRAIISLGCARGRGDTAMEMLALEAGVNRLALPSDEAVERARSMGLEIRYQTTCCCIGADMSAASWAEASGTEASGAEASRPGRRAAVAG